MGKHIGVARRAVPQVHPVGFGATPQPTRVALSAPSVRRKRHESVQSTVMGSGPLQPVLFIGHERGARVARRSALEYPDDLTGAALLDILPEESIYDRLAAAEITQRYWHWIFHLVPTLPEQLMSGKEEEYLAALFGHDPSLPKKRSKRRSILLALASLSANKASATRGSTILLALIAPSTNRDKVLLWWTCGACSRL